jgi:hypothetical protein
MTAITHAVPPAPELSRELRWTVEDMTDPSFRVQTPWPPLIAEARAVLPAFRQACAPASRRVVGDWFFGINLAVGNPLAATDYDFRLVLIQDMCSDLPGCVFNAETRREALQTYTFVPTPAEVYKLLLPHGRTLRDRLRCLETIAAMGAAKSPIDPEAAERQAERAAIVAMTQAERNALVEALLAKSREAFLTMEAPGQTRLPPSEGLWAVEEVDPALVCRLEQIASPGLVDQWRLHVSVPGLATPDIHDLFDRIEREVKAVTPPGV